MLVALLISVSCRVAMVTSSPNPNQMASVEISSATATSIGSSFLLSVSKDVSSRRVVTVPFAKVLDILRERKVCKTHMDRKNRSDLCVVRLGIVDNPLLPGTSLGSYC